MAIRTARARWDGSLQAGMGRMALGSGAFDGPYSFASRFENGTGTNPEELIAAAHAGCFSMALAAALGRNGFEPQSVSTGATLQVLKQDAGLTITTIELETEAHVPGIDEAKFQEIAEGARSGCIVSRALAGVEIKLHAKLLG
jgi:osmotically inducible protein OsmC